MGKKPFIPLVERREVNRLELPPDLAEFHAWHEGMGQDCPPDRTVRLWKLKELTTTDRAGLGLNCELPEGWEGWKRFSAFDIGRGMYFEKILYILSAPICPPGSIFAIGTILVGVEGGNGPLRLDGSLVLSRTFSDWLTHLERWDWDEPIFAGMGGLPARKWEEARRYYAEFNPHARDWEAPTA